MANVKLNSGENLLKEGSAGVVTGKLRGKQGRCFLTTQRLVFHKKGMVSSMFLGYLFGYFFSFLYKGKFDFDISLIDVKSLSRTQYMLSKNVLCIETEDGKEYKFLLKFDDWFDAINNALLAYHQCRLVEEGDQKWIVQK